MHSHFQHRESSIRIAFTKFTTEHSNALKKKRFRMKESVAYVVAKVASDGSGGKKFHIVHKSFDKTKKINCLIHKELNFAIRCNNDRKSKRLHWLRLTWYTCMYSELKIATQWQLQFYLFRYVINFLNFLNLFST